jgi:hypothetical protein
MPSADVSRTHTRTRGKFFLRGLKTGEHLAISYAPGHQWVHYHPGHTISIVHSHYVVTLEGRQLFALFEALHSWESHMIWPFSADTFHLPAPGEPLVELIRCTPVSRATQLGLRHADGDEHGRSTRPRPSPSE